MTILKCKGTKVQQEISTVLTDVAQVISADGPDPEVETFEADALDNASAGILMEPTGRAGAGTLSFEVFFDPALAGHQELTADITTPKKKDWAIVFSDTTAWPFEGILKTVSPTVDLADGLKASVEVELADLVTYPT